MSLMLHTKPYGHWTFCSEDEDFYFFLPYMDVAVILVIWPKYGKQTFIS